MDFSYLIYNLFFSTAIKLFQTIELVGYEYD